MPAASFEGNAAQNLISGHDYLNEENFQFKDMNSSSEFVSELRKWSKRWINETVPQHHYPQKSEDGFKEIVQTRETSSCFSFSFTDSSTRSEDLICSSRSWNFSSKRDS